MINPISLILSSPKLTFAGGLAAFTATTAVVTNSMNSKDESEDYLLRQVPDDEKLLKREGGKRDWDWSELMDGKKFEEAPLVNVSYKKLIFGDKTYNDGNYVIYYGSEACTHCTGFLFGDQNISRGNLWLERDKMSDGVFMKAFESTRLDEDLKNLNIKFLMYEDVPDINKTSVDSAYWSLPWATWEEDDLAKGRIAGEYKRNDKSAKEFRRVFQAAQEKFGRRVAGTPTLLLYKEGIPIVYNQTDLPGLKVAKQGEDLSEVVELKRFIKHFYTQTEFVDKKKS